MLQYHCEKCKKTYVADKENHDEYIDEWGLCADCSGMKLEIIYPNKKVKRIKNKLL